LEEGLLVAATLSASENRLFQRYVQSHKPDVNEFGKQQLSLLTLQQFLERFYDAVYKGRGLLVGFNLPFDLSRIAFRAAAARGKFTGGISLALWTYLDNDGAEREDHHRPRVCIKQIDSKRALKGFAARFKPDLIDLIPENSDSGKPREGTIFRGHFLDLRTLAFALTDRGDSLETACRAFNVEHSKEKADQHGVINEKYIDYNRRDVLATAELATKLLEEYGKHPINLQVTKAYSPASIGKAYLRSMGIEPILFRQPNFPKDCLGYAQSAFFGGRTSAHVRKVAVPVVSTDFLSMYPTVNCLMGLWNFTTAREISVNRYCRLEIASFLKNLSAETLFRPETWKQLAGFVKVIPDGDILPSRARYNPATNDWQVGVNKLYGSPDDPKQALSFSLPDIAASVLLTGRVPRILDAFRIKAIGKLPTLRGTSLRGGVPINPRSQDFFKTVIEERKNLASRKDLSDTERDRLDKALKVLANSTSYGIYAEMQRKESDKKVSVKCRGIDPRWFRCRVRNPDEPGEYCFPPAAALITGAARLMLSLLEYSIRERGGTYAMEDTDSMAIVSSEKGGLVPCPGGECETVDDQPAIRALSWGDVREISDRFKALNPYDRTVVPKSILKIEPDNFEPNTGKQRQLYCVAISAKRYALFVKDKSGNPQLLRKGVNNSKNRWSEHGLGHLLNPTDPSSDDREWIARAWSNIIRRTLSQPVLTLTFGNVPAVGRVSVSSAAVLRAFDDFNQNKNYSEQVKPFNFLLSCHLIPFGQPTGTSAERFHLIAPYRSNRDEWLKVDWIDQYSGKRYRIKTDGHHGGRDFARVKTYDEILSEYEYHAETKCADSDGTVCSQQTIGLLQRREVKIDYVKYIGKESNSLEVIDAGMVHSAESVYTEYLDAKRDEWTLKILPVLKTVPLATLVKMSGMSRRALLDLRAGRSRPHRQNQELLVQILKRLGQRD